ncbi:uncharacterized protein LOC111829940 [Capsella rubella]|uniref:uncharacterized protein LOC111829940 n=1 Tax=Capsella rubella TaxID=81985 RepID=UPI000CD534AA|nr:uncharacterized protein LOC111829940 [Capsella rubella]
MELLTSWNHDSKSEVEEKSAAEELGWLSYTAGTTLLAVCFSTLEVVSVNLKRVDKDRSLESLCLKSLNWCGTSLVCDTLLAKSHAIIPRLVSCHHLNQYLRLVDCCPAQAAFRLTYCC